METVIILDNISEHPRWKKLIIGIKKKFKIDIKKYLNNFLKDNINGLVSTTF